MIDTTALRSNTGTGVFESNQMQQVWRRLEDVWHIEQVQVKIGVFLTIHDLARIPFLEAPNSDLQQLTPRIST